MSQYIACVPTGVLLGRSRYPDRHEAPGIKAWRCELTGLSQLHNIYFVACNDTIHVYQPSFPDQSLSKDPELILHPPISSPDLDPDTDPDDPHSITRLLVDYLGNDEILLATCDDGDVIGYRVEEIKRCLDGRHGAFSSEADHLYAGDIRTFLHRNVGASAWGLAVHREARMIAISANTHEVTVLAYALATRGNESPESELFDPSPIVESTETTDFPSPRKRDHVIMLQASYNIPAVSFNNNAEDNTGRWIFSSCIDGQNTLWDLHNPEQPARVFQMGWCAKSSHPEYAPQILHGRCICNNWRTFPHGAWGVIFLDPCSAHEMSSEEGRDIEPAQRAPYFEDFNHQKERFRVVEANLSYLSEVNEGDASPDSASTMVMSESESEVSNDTMDVDPESVDDESHSFTDQAVSDDEMSETAEEEDNQEAEGEVPEYTGPPLPPMQTSPSPDGPFQQNVAAMLATQSLPPNLTIDEVAQILYIGNDPDEEDGEEEGLELSFNPVTSNFSFIPIHAMTRRQPNPYCEISTNPSFQSSNTKTPCLIITKDDIFLIQRPLYSASNGSSPDYIPIMRRPLHPGLQDQKLASYDRHCYSTHIPELGIFIIASPVGRAAIFALTKSRNPITYGFQLEYILPFASGDENEITSPEFSNSRLVGVAAGPVQGSFDLPGERGTGPKGRRWRLLMYYMDHTVLSFEISRKRAGGDVGLGDLIV